MDGLECSEINKEYILKNTYDFRIESEFFKKDDLASISKLCKLNFEILEKGLSDVITDGTHFTPHYIDEGIPFLSAINVRENSFNPSAGYKFISPEEHFQLCKRVRPKQGDVLLRKVGVGPRWACVVPENTFDFSIFVSIALIRPKINPYFLSVYLNSKYGQLQLLRFNKGISQPDLHLEDIGKTIVPLFANEFYAAIENAVKLAEKSIKNSSQEIEKADKTIEQALGFSKHKNTAESKTIRLLSGSFKDTGRLDAEYYQSKYQFYENLILSANSGYTLVKRVFTPVKDKCSRTKESYDYVEIGDIDVGTGAATYNSVKTEDLPDNAKIMTCSEDILISTVRPNRGAVAILERDGLLVSGAFTVLRANGDYPKEVLQALFRTRMYKDWLLRYNVGTSYPVIKDEDVLNMPIPILNDIDKITIVNNVKNATILRRKSKQLLDFSKQAVEMAIEQGEDIALAWLKANVHNLEV